MAEAPNRSYSFACVTGSTSIWIAPFDGEDLLISAMIFIFVDPLIFSLKGMISPEIFDVNFLPFRIATSFSFSLMILFKIVILDYSSFCFLTDLDYLLEPFHICTSFYTFICYNYTILVH